MPSLKVTVPLKGFGNLIRIKKLKLLKVKKFIINFIDRYADDTLTFIFSHNTIHNDKNLTGSYYQ